MHIIFRYPPGWRTSGKTIVASMGNVGRAEVIGGTQSTFGELNAASCAERVGLVGDGAFVVWNENIGAPFQMKLSGRPGNPLSVNGYPARLADTTSTDCGRRDRVLTGTLQVATNKFLLMSAEVALNASPTTIEEVRELFASARP